MAKRSFIIAAVIITLILGIILQQVSPTQAGPVGILLFFGLLYVLFLIICTFIVYGLSYVLARIGARAVLRRPLQQLRFTQAYYFASVLALLPVILLGANSVGGVSVFDAILVAVFGILGCIYVAKKMP